MRRPMIIGTCNSSISWQSTVQYRQGPCIVASVRILRNLDGLWFTSDEADRLVQNSRQIQAGPPEKIQWYCFGFKL